MIGRYALKYIEERFWRLSTGDAIPIIDDEEWHACQSKLPRDFDVRFDGLCIAVAAQRCRGFVAIETHGFREVDERIGGKQRTLFTEVRAIEALNHRVLPSMRVGKVH